MIKKGLIFWIVISILGFCKETSSIILKRNIFVKPPPPPPKVETILKPPPLPSLDSLIEITGIVYFPEGNSYVIIRDKKNREENVYKEGEIVKDAKIVKIEVDKVIFEYDGKTISLNLENISSEAPVIISKTEIGQPEVVIPDAPKIPEKVITMDVDFNQTISQLASDKNLVRNVNLTPNVNNGKVEGFKVFNLPVESIPYKYGLRNGDIIRSVNGILIDSLATAFKVYNQIKNSNTNLVTIEILRNNKPILLTYRLNNK